MELKLNDESTNLFLLQRSNRTFMELKYAFRIVDAIYEKF